MEICKVVLTGKYIMQITLIKLKLNTTMKFHHPIKHFKSDTDYANFSIQDCYIYIL